MEHKYRRVFVEVNYENRSYRMGFDGGFTEAEQEGFMARGEGIARKMLAMKNPTEPLQMTDEDLKPGGDQ